jgi:hypothetical protein
MPLSAVKRDIVIGNPRVAHSENTRMWAEKKLFAFLTTNSVPQPDLSRVRPGKSASRQLVQCIAAGWVPAWKGVYRAESIVSRSTAFWGGRYAFEAFRVRRPAEFPEPRFEEVCGGIAIAGIARERRRVGGLFFRALGGRVRANAYSRARLRAWGGQGGRPPKLDRKAREWLRKPLADRKNQAECASILRVSVRPVGRAVDRMKSSENKSELPAIIPLTRSKCIGPWEMNR